MNDDLTDVTEKYTVKSENKSIIEYLAVLVLIIYAGGASIFVRSFSPDKPLAILLPILMGSILVLKSGIVFNRNFYLLLLGYVLYYFAIAFKYQTIHPVFFMIMLINFIVVYLFVKTLKDNLFVIYKDLILLLAITGLIMWLLQIILGGDNLYNLIGRIPSINTFSNVSSNGFNIIFYSIQPASQIMVQNSLTYRNCGFAWEPGGFAVFLVLAIFIHLFFIRSEVKFNLRFWILVIALLSTQSTTGYVIFILMMIFYLFQKNIKIVLLLFPALILGIVLMASLPFMRDKILLYFEEAGNVDIIVEQSVGNPISRNPQRFASFVIAFRDFKNNPVFGYGGQTEERWYTKINSNISPISGIGNLLAQYGLVGFIFFIALLIKSSRFYSRHFNYGGSYSFLLVMLLITVSYSIILAPMIMCFWMFAYFEDYGPIQNESVTNTSQPK